MTAAAPPNTPASATLSEGSTLALPDQNALCDLHGASRTNAAGSQAQRGQLVAQPSSTRTALRAISSVKLTSKEVSALLKNKKENTGGREY